MYTHTHTHTYRQHAVEMNSKDRHRDTNSLTHHGASGICNHSWRTARGSTSSEAAATMLRPAAAPCAAMGPGECEV